MKYLFLLSLLALFTSCSSFVPKMEPEHKGVDPILEEYQEEFFELALERGIVFNGKVTMGITDIKKKTSSDTIGTCTRSLKWREIDIDKDFFDKSSYLQKKALLFHELVHCYCGRIHTYGVKAEKDYPDGFLDKIVEKFTAQEDDLSIPEEDRPYFDNGCPRSIMHPTLVGSICMFVHHDHYINEMFNGCNPY